MIDTKFAGALAGALAACLLVVGCGSSDPDYYTLRAWPGTTQPGGPLSLKIRTPSVAGYLDRDYIVSGDRDYRLKLDQKAAWGEPLADMVAQTLAADLQQRLPGTTVFTQAGAISTDAQATVELDIIQFAKTHDGLVELSGSLSVQPVANGNSAALPAGAQTLHLTMTPDNAGTSGEVAALSRLLGQVADQAAEQARRIAPPSPASVGAPVVAAEPTAAGVPVALAPR